MACSPGSEASLEGISLGSSEEAELRREGRKRWGGEAGEGYSAFNRPSHSGLWSTWAAASVGEIWMPSLPGELI